MPLLLYLAAACSFPALPPLLTRTLCLDLVKAVEFTFVYPTALHSCLVPAILAGQVHVPERPSPALQWTHRIYLTNSPAFSIVQKGAVPVRPFLQAQPQSHSPDLAGPQVNLAYLQKLRYQPQLISAHPHVPRIARAALPALLTLEVQPVCVPFSAQNICSINSPVWPPLDARMFLQYQ